MTSLLGVFARHRVAANLLMVMMLLSGVIALKQLNVQFFPNFELDQITVSTTWSGANSEDIQTGITTPLEQRLRSIDNLKEMTSTSTTGVSGITLEFDEVIDRKGYYFVILCWLRTNYFRPEGVLLLRL